MIIGVVIRMAGERENVKAKDGQKSGTTISESRSQSGMPSTEKDTVLGLLHRRNPIRKNGNDG